MYNWQVDFRPSVATTDPIYKHAHIQLTGGVKCFSQAGILYKTMDCKQNNLHIEIQNICCQVLLIDWESRTKVDCWDLKQISTNSNPGIVYCNFSWAWDHNEEAHNVNKLKLSLGQVSCAIRDMRLTTLVVNWSEVSCALLAWERNGQTHHVWDRNTEAQNMKKLFDIKDAREALACVNQILQSTRCRWTWWLAYLHASACAQGRIE